MVKAGEPIGFQKQQQISSAMRKTSRIPIQTCFKTSNICIQNSEQPEICLNRRECEEKIVWITNEESLTNHFMSIKSIHEFAVDNKTAEPQMVIGNDNYIDLILDRLR